MKKKHDPATSSVIMGYELLKQQMELEEDKNYIAKIEDIK